MPRFRDDYDDERGVLPRDTVEGSVPATADSDDSSTVVSTPCSFSLGEVARQRSLSMPNQSTERAARPALLMTPIGRVETRQIMMRRQ